MKYRSSNACIKAYIFKENEPQKYSVCVCVRVCGNVQGKRLNKDRERGKQ